MLFSIGILIVSSLILMIFDHHSRYSFFFLLMAAGNICSLVSLVFHISVFGNHYIYTTNPLYMLDYRLYLSLVRSFRLPLASVLRFMNADLFLYQLSNCLFALELNSCLQWYRPDRKFATLAHRLAFAVPVITIVFCDPRISNLIYTFCHRNPGTYPLLLGVTILSWCPPSAF